MIGGGSNLDIFTSIDLEMNQPSNKIIEVGACVGNIRTEQIIEKKQWFVNPHEKLGCAEPYDIVKLTGIKQEDVDGGIELQEAYDHLQTLHKMHGSFINPLVWGGDDVTYLLQQLDMGHKRSDGCSMFGRRDIDVKTVFISWRLSQGQQIQGGLAKSITKLGLKFIGRKHRAMDDATNTFYAYCKLMKKFRS